MKVLQTVAILVVATLIAALAVFADGFDVKKVKLNTQNIWILQTGADADLNAATRYGVANTEINELASFNSVTNPTNLVQAENGSLLFSGAKYLNVNPATPIDFAEDTETAVALDGTPDSVEVGIEIAAFLEGGKLLVSTQDSSGFGKPSLVALPEGVESINAIAITDDQQVLAFSVSAQKVIQFSPITQQWTSRSDSVNSLEIGTETGSFQLAAIGDRWALLERGSGSLWMSGSPDALTNLGLGEALQLQRSSTVNPNQFFIASSTNFTSVNFDNRSVGEISQEVPGGLIAARPIGFGTGIYGAWLSEGEGWFFNSADPTAELKPLSFGNKSLDANILADPEKDELVFQTNGVSAVINDTYSGWAWSLPTGRLVVGTQDWDNIIPPPIVCKGPKCPPPPNPGTPKPPVARNDLFGVRAGDLITLPVLLNDSDPNEGDVLTVVPSSLTGLSAGFGEVRVSSQQQQVTVRVKDSATGSAKFTYKISDGTGTKDSNTATVTLKVTPKDQNDAPEHCSDLPNSDCLQELPEASVATGSDVSIAFLDGWVDPDGDRFFISDAQITAGEGNLAYTSSGELVFQNEDLEGGASSQVDTKITVSDVRGAKTTVDFSITVRPNTPFAFSAPILVLAPEVPLVIDFAKFASGVQGILSIADISTTSTNSLQIEQLGDSKVKFVAKNSKPSQVQLKIKDGSGASIDASIRVTIVEQEKAQLSTSPVTVLVSPGLDTSIDLFTAAHNPANRALVVSDIRVSARNGALISADKIKGGFLRIRGKNTNDVPGFVGVVKYKISDGSEGSNYVADGQAYIYQMPNADAKPVVSRRDTVTVRAGQATEVDVLANDLGAPGVPLAIDAKSLIQNEDTSCLPGGLVFASGGKIRIVAPDEAGGFSCAYSIYGANNPLIKTLGTLIIRVVADDETNLPPVALDLFARVRAGDTVNIPIASQGADPDGDAVLVNSIAGVQGQKGAGYINPEGSSISYTALSDADGQDTFTYTLVDSKGLVSAEATVKVAILQAAADTAPVTINDYAEVLVGGTNKVVMDPLANDFDPQPSINKPMALVANSVVPDAPVNSSNYKLWSSLVAVDGNKITVNAASVPLSMRFIYTAQSSSGSRSSGYVTIKVTNDAKDDAPDILDTFASLSDAARFTGSGIDVVTNKVTWTSGNTADLKLDIWSDSTGLRTVSGTNVAGTEFPKNQKVVIFKLSGINFSGQEVTSYGFLHLPGTTPKITFDPANSKQEVKEGASVSFDMADLTNLDEGLEIGKVKAHGVRESAKCEVRSGTELTYTAGNGSPWSDFCDVQVKLAGSDKEFQTLFVPIAVIPIDPQPELSPQRLEVPAGTNSQEVYDLIAMTTWPGKTDAEIQKLNYEFEGGEQLFKIDQDGSKLTISEQGNLEPGTSAVVKISLPDYPKTKSANLTLVVGQIQGEIPELPTLVLVCSISEGQDMCRKDLDDLKSLNPDYNLVYGPFGYTQGQVSYGSTQTCENLTLRTKENILSVTWPSNATGVKCQREYVVIDENGKASNQKLELTFSGNPGKVRSVKQVAFTQSSVELQIIGPRESFPEVSEFEIVDENGQEYSCDAVGSAARCEIPNLRPYDGKDNRNKHTYRVKAVNPEGVSSVAYELKGVYAYKTPNRLTSNNVKARAIYDPDLSPDSPNKGLAEVTVNPIADPLISGYEANIQGLVGDIQSKTPNSNYAPLVYKIAGNVGFKTRVTVTALNRVPPPVDFGISTNSINLAVQISGRPKLSDVSAKVKKSGGSWIAEVTANKADRNYSSQPIKIMFGLMKESSSGSGCEFTESDGGFRPNPGSGVILGNVVTEGGSTSKTVNLVESWRDELSGMEQNGTYVPFVCYSNGFGFVMVNGDNISTLADPASNVFRYDIVLKAGTGKWHVQVDKSAAPANVKVQFNSTVNRTSTEWSDDVQADAYGADLTIWARYCLIDRPNVCSDGKRKLNPVSSSRMWQLEITGVAQVTAEGQIPGACVFGRDLAFDLDGRGLGSPDQPNWQIAGTPQYVRSNGATGDLEYSGGNNWRLPRGSGYQSILVKFAGSSSKAKVKGLTGPTKEFTFNCR